MLRLQQIKLEIPNLAGKEEVEHYQFTSLSKKIIKILHITPQELLQFQPVKISIDARKKPRLFYSIVVDVWVKNEKKVWERCKSNQIQRLEETSYQFPKVTVPHSLSPVIVGMGPAGLFCGYFLAKHGFCPILVERGKSVEERQKDVELFWETGQLNPQSNVQFGEGGAGTFSDGKLNTLVKDKYGRNKEVLRVLVENGAPKNILYDSKPHIGTDILQIVVRNMREKMLQWGAQIFFETKMTKLLQNNGAISDVELSDGRIISTDKVVLAIGHSARDTFQMCLEQKIPMEPKPFAVGFRVEHPQELINRTQYGDEYPKCLPAAAYKVTARADNGRGVYSFCMCPGGYVVNASSEPGKLAINGMSYSKRDGKNANSAIIVSVSPKDYPGQGPLSGVEFQRQIESKAFQIGKGKIPVQYYKDFKGKEEHSGRIPEKFQPAMKGKYVFAPVNQILPKELNDAFVQGMEQFHRCIPGFGDDYACVSGIESRTSSPVRILREEDGQSRLKGLYPCGEGAGYAGGITSAAMDGIFIAEKIAQCE